ncbi:MAG TPA: DUF5680 domain-containing protein [Patescibacteria group bacterium]
MNINDLRRFLIYCGKEGYATISEEGMIIESDQSTSIRIKKGDWQYHDNYFGGEPYGGREVVFYQVKPVWMMTYYGCVGDSVEDLKSVYQHLKKALTLFPADAPFRGPKEFTEGNYSYKNRWDGDVEKFSGEEEIYHHNQKIYTAKYIGGVVDVR